MRYSGLIAVACLIGGLPLTAWGLTEGKPAVFIPGLALVLAFVYLAWSWIADADRASGAPAKITPAADAAWKLRDQPLRAPPADADGDSQQRGSQR